jgi:2'-5' RNA ligase
MQEANDKRRLFWAMEVDAPWPATYPKGRLIDETMRHITLAFLGNVSPEPLLSHLEELPPPPFRVGPAGRLEKMVLLPEDSPRVVAAKIHWLTQEDEIEAYQSKLIGWLESLGYRLQHNPYLPHVSIARAPFIAEQWEEAFESLPIIVPSIRLYESMGNLQYKTLWERPLIAPFEEFEHTADIAFHIRGGNYRDLLIHAAMALASKFPPILPLLREAQVFSTLEQVIYALNEMVTTCDTTIGCPFKAVSHHGKVREEKRLIFWEMIVDV